MQNNIINLLDNLGVKYRWLTHPAVYTVADLNNLTEEISPVKNLLIQEEGCGRKFLVIMDGNSRMDQKLIRDKFKAKRLRFVSDEILLETFDVTPGAVSIFGLLNGGANNVEVIVDEEIIKRDAELGFHPNDNTATIFFKPKDLIPILDNMNSNYTVMKLY